MRALLWGVLLCLAPSLALAADSPRAHAATQRMFDAMFSLEALQPPDGRSTAPKDFVATDAPERQLIAYLAILQREGADFNAVRAQGTPLHHAIRAGWNRLAHWLLEHGADPRRRTEGDDADALGAAVRSGNWEILQALRRHPAFKDQTSMQFAQASWPVLLDDPQASAAFWARKPPLPDPRQQPALAEDLLHHALCSAQLSLVQALLQQAPADPQRGVRLWALACSQQVPLVAPDAALLKHWHEIEARLAQPLRALWFVPVQDEASLAAWRRLDALDAPWKTPQGSKAYWIRLLDTRSPFAPALVRQMPEPTLRALLEDPEHLRQLLQAAAQWPLPDARWALAQIDEARFQSQQARWIDAWDAAPPASESHWRLLTERLRAPVRSDAEGPIHRLPVVLWPRWFELGWTPADRGWPGWAHSASQANFEAGWRVLQRHRPSLASQALVWLLDAVSVPRDGAAPVPGLRSPSDGVADADAEKLQFLRAQGLGMNPPRWLSAGADLDDPGVRMALEAGWLVQAPQGLRGQVEVVEGLCAQAPSAALLATLRRPDRELYNFVGVSVNGRCAWLAMEGNDVGGRKFIDDSSFFGERAVLTPCADGDQKALFWEEGRRQWVEVWGSGVTDLTVVRRRGQVNEVGLLTAEQDQGGCGQRSGMLLLPSWDGQQLHLEAAPAEHPLQRALALQCNLREVSRCLEAAQAKDMPAPVLGSSAGRLLARFAPEQLQPFLQALQALDRPRLKAEQQRHLFPEWLDIALDRLGPDDSLDTMAKRKRAAWILAQRKPAAALSDRTLQGLMPWLPAEDWGVIAWQLACRGETHRLESAAAQAEAMDLRDIAGLLERQVHLGCQRPH